MNKEENRSKAEAMYISIPQRVKSKRKEKTYNFINTERTDTTKKVQRLSTQ